jgi:hypothetical protein
MRYQTQAAKKLGNMHIQIKRQYRPGFYEWADDRQSNRLRKAIMDLEHALAWAEKWSDLSLVDQAITKYQGEMIALFSDFDAYQRVSAQEYLMMNAQQSLLGIA